MLAKYSTFKASQIILFEVLAAVEEVVKKGHVIRSLSVQPITALGGAGYGGAGGAVHDGVGGPIM